MRRSRLSLVRAFVADAWARYPEEACGVVLRTAMSSRGRWLRVVPMANAARREERRVRFAFDDHAWLRLLKELEPRGEELAYIYHSHAEGGAALSDRDVREAAPSGRVLVGSNVGQVVVALRAASRPGRQTEVVAQVAWYRWRGEAYALARRLVVPGLLTCSFEELPASNCQAGAFRL